MPLMIFCMMSYGQDRYVQVVDRNSHNPYDSFDMGFYHVVNGNFVFVGNSLTDSNGIAKVPEAFGSEGRVNGNNISPTRKCIWPVVENIRNFDSGTYVLFADRMTDCGRRGRIQNVYFAYDQARLIDFYKSLTDSLIKVLEENPAFKVELRAHTDNKGEGEYNIHLSQKRADAVKNYIVSKGIKRDRIITKAFGSSSPIVPNEKDGQDDPEGRAMNRRVEFIILTSEQ